MRLTFSDDPTGRSSLNPPIFSRVTDFKTTGVVMNVFLLDPSIRLLSAFVWVSTSNTIGLYALPDWNKKEYVFIDTGIECVRIIIHLTIIFWLTYVLGYVFQLVMYIISAKHRDPLRRKRCRFPTFLSPLTARKLYEHSIGC